MNLTKTLLLLLTVVLVFSCKQDELLEQTNGQTAGLTADLSQYDESNIGLYKGAFTTLDATERGIVEVTILNDAPSRASLTLVSGETFVLKSTTNATAGQVLTNLHFIPEAETATTVAFDFSVNHDGSDVRINNVYLGGNSSSVIVAKETSRDPVNPVTGTYTCTTCGTHPTLGTTPEAFNSLFVGAGTGNDTMTTDITVSGSSFVSTSNTQSGCVTDSPIAGFNTCVIAGSTNFGTLMSWMGTHTYDSSATLCSEAAGTWSVNGTIHGDLAGTFVGDVTCVPTCSTCLSGSANTGDNLGHTITDGNPCDDSTVTMADTGVIGVDASITSVEIDITHTWTGDLDITLNSPEGSSLLLMSGVGGSGDDLVDTVFADGGADITGGTAPFTGTWEPMGGTFASTFDGECTDGVWTITICDGAGGDDGTLNDLTVTFACGPAPLVVDTSNNTFRLANDPPEMTKAEYIKLHGKLEE